MLCVCPQAPILLNPPDEVGSIIIPTLQMPHGGSGHTARKGWSHDVRAWPCLIPRPALVMINGDSTVSIRVQSGTQKPRQVLHTEEVQHSESFHRCWVSLVFLPSGPPAGRTHEEAAWQGSLGNAICGLSGTEVHMDGWVEAETKSEGPVRCLGAWLRTSAFCTL